MKTSQLLPGALAGLLATGPMTLVMEALFRRLPRTERYPLPPSEITSVASEKLGVADEVEPAEHVALTLAGHFGYGAATGAAYAVLIPAAGPGLGKGILYGLLVWAGSYLGWLPALGLLTPATEHPLRRNALMIAAHVVWGAVLGQLVEEFQRRRFGA